MTDRFGEMVCAGNNWSCSLFFKVCHEREEIPLPFLWFLSISMNTSMATVPVSYSTTKHTRINPSRSAVTMGPKLTEPLQHQLWAGPDTTRAVPPPCPTQFPGGEMMLKDIN